MKTYTDQDIEAKAKELLSIYEIGTGIPDALGDIQSNVYMHRGFLALARHCLGLPAGAVETEEEKEGRRLEAAYVKAVDAKTMFDDPAYAEWRAPLGSR